MKLDENSENVGSNPTPSAIFTRKTEEVGNQRSDSAQTPAESEIQRLQFPKNIRYRKDECKIYVNAGHGAFYRVAWRARGRPRN
jgi:hypothetical protein